MSSVYVMPSPYYIVPTQCLLDKNLNGRPKSLNQIKTDLYLSLLHCLQAIQQSRVLKFNTQFLLHTGGIQAA